MQRVHCEILSSRVKQITRLLVVRTATEPESVNNPPQGGNVKEGGGGAEYADQHFRLQQGGRRH